jgi:hypothetical protein
VDHRQPAPDQRGLDLAGLVRATHVRVGVVNPDDPPAETQLVDDEAGGLDLRQFGHGSQASDVRLLRWIPALPGIKRLSATRAARAAT